MYVNPWSSLMPGRDEFLMQSGWGQDTQCPIKWNATVGRILGLHTLAEFEHDLLPSCLWDVAFDFLGLFIFVDLVKPYLQVFILAEGGQEFGLPVENMSFQPRNERRDNSNRPRPPPSQSNRQTWVPRASAAAAVVDSNLPRPSSGNGSRGNSTHGPAAPPRDPRRTGNANAFRGHVGRPHYRRQEKEKGGRESEGVEEVKDPNMPQL
ncbi:hypothetical protein Tsubulata_048893, partial [Turnera subulata]